LFLPIETSGRLAVDRVADLETLLTEHSRSLAIVLAHCLGVLQMTKKQGKFN
jgi:hypothetical protein